MPVLVGLVLTPVGAWIGTILLFAGMTVVALRQTLSGNELIGAIYFGTIIGSAFAAPVTLVVLPAAHAVLQRKSRLTLGKLAGTGAIAGFSSVIIVMSCFWGPKNLFADLGALAVTSGVGADGAVTGAICGYLFGRITRWLGPAKWHVAEPRV